MIIIQKKIFWSIILIYILIDLLNANEKCLRRGWFPCRPVVICVGTRAGMETRPYGLVLFFFAVEHHRKRTPQQDRHRYPRRRRG